DLREEMYQAYATRASELGPQAGQFNNWPVMQEILALRQELAQLLGFANYAERSLATKMTESTTQVLDFLNDLASKALPAARQEYADLQAFAAAQGVADLQPWD